MVQSVVLQFIAALITQRFPDCNIFQLYDSSLKYENVYFHSSPAFYNIKFTAHSIATLFSKKNPSSIEPQFFGTYGPVGKHRRNCGVAVLFFHEINTSISDILFGLLTPKHWPAMKKDMDHFIFAPGSPAVLQSKFASKLKYKIHINVPNSQHVLVQTICFFCNNGAPKTIDIFGTVSTNFSKFSMPQVQELFPDLVRKFNGFEFIVANSVKTSHRGSMIWKNGRFEPLGGVSIIVLDTVLRPLFNFSLKLIDAHGDKSAGRQMKNGSWTGAIVDVLTGNAHMGMTLCQTVQRSELIGFSYSVAYDWITFTTGKTQGTFSWTAIYKPFRLGIWVGLVFAMLVTIVALICTSNVLSTKWGIGRTAQYTVGTLLEQGLETFGHNSPRIIVASWLLFSLVMANAYRSLMFSFLIFPMVTTPPHDFEELANNADNYKWGMSVPKGGAYSIFASSNETTYKKIFHGMELVDANYECYRRAAMGKYACIAWNSRAEHYIARNFTDRNGQSSFETAKSFTYFTACGYGMEKRAIFKSNFDKVLLMGHDSGLLQKLSKMDADTVRMRRFEWERSGVDVSKSKLDVTAFNSKHGEPRPLQVANLVGALYLSMVYVGISAAILFVECLVAT